MLPSAGDPGYEAYGCIYYNSEEHDWVCKNATFAFLMMEHISAVSTFNISTPLTQSSGDEVLIYRGFQVDYDRKNGISVWDIKDPTNPLNEYGSYSHCISTTAGCVDAQANFYSRMVSHTTEPHVVSGFKEGHSSAGV